MAIVMASFVTIFVLPSGFNNASSPDMSLNKYGTVQTNMQMEIERLKAIPEKITVLFLDPGLIQTFQSLLLYVRQR